MDSVVEYKGGDKKIGKSPTFNKALKDVIVEVQNRAGDLIRRFRSLAEAGGASTEQMLIMDDLKTKLDMDTPVEVTGDILSKTDISPFSAESVSLVVENPTSKTSVSIKFEYEHEAGFELTPGKRILLHVPAEYRTRIIRDVVLKHRKSHSRFMGRGWDPEGAYSRVLIREPRKNEWVGWVDPSGYNSDKFAEPRPATDPETEVLHDWVATVGKLNSELVSVENVGNGPNAVVNFHSIELVFFPELNALNFKEEIFSEGTQFIDLAKGVNLPSFGGGPNRDGKYPGALELNKYDLPGKIQNRESLVNARGELVVPLENGKRLLSVELAVGDTHPDGIRNKDGHIGTLGWAKIDMDIVKGGVVVDTLTRGANVPPAGVLFGGPTSMGGLKINGESLVITAKGDIAYVMGYRLAYAD